MHSSYAWTREELLANLASQIRDISFVPDDIYSTHRVVNLDSVLEILEDAVATLKPHVLVSDDSGHDYLILKEDREDFRQWVHQEECWEAYESEPGDGGLVRTATTDYDAARVEGSLEIYLFDC